MASTYDVRRSGENQNKQTVLDSTGYVVETFADEYSIIIDEGTSDDVQTVELGAQASGTPSVLPSVGDSHPNKPNATADKVTTKRLSTIHYESTVTYKTPAYEAGGGGGGDDPTNLPGKIRVFTSYDDREIDYDYDGNALMNPVTEEPYSLITEQADFGIHITKNMAVFDLVASRGLIDKVNSDSFLGFEPGQARIYSLEAETAQTGGDSYWVVQAQILFREVVEGDDPLTAWYQRVIRKGFYAMTTGGVRARIGLKSNGEYGVYPDDTDNAVTTRVLLNEDDEILNLLPTDSNDPVFDLKKHKGSVNFTNIGLL